MVISESSLVMRMRAEIFQFRICLIYLLYSESPVNINYIIESFEQLATKHTWFFEVTFIFNQWWRGEVLCVTAIRCRDIKNKIIAIIVALKVIRYIST